VGKTRSWWFQVPITWLDHDDVLTTRSLSESSDSLLVQLEVSVETVVAVKIARKAHVPVLLDPASVPREFPVDRFDVDLICPNESETAALVGEPADSIEDAEAAARERQNRRCR
jgi:ribokinase